MMEPRSLTRHEEQRYNTVYLAICGALAIQAAAQGWMWSRPWMIAVSGLLAAVGLGLLWRRRHPRTPAEPYALEPPGAQARLDRLACLVAFAAWWLAALTLGVAARVCHVPWLYVVAVAMAAASAAPIVKLRGLRSERAAGRS